MAFHPLIPSADAADANTSKPRREKKEAFKIDFLSPEEKSLKEVSKELFAPVTRGAGITLVKPSTAKASANSRRTSKSKKAKEREKRDEHILPDDMHFTSQQLVTLFLKPKFSVRFHQECSPGN